MLSFVEVRGSGFRADRMKSELFTSDENKKKRKGKKRSIYKREAESRAS